MSLLSIKKRGGTAVKEVTVQLMNNELIIEGFDAEFDSNGNLIITDEAGYNWEIIDGEIVTT